MSAPFELLQRVGVHGAFDRMIGRRPGVTGAGAYGVVDRLRARPTGAAIETLGAVARAVRKANHPGLQQVLGAGRAEGTAFVMSELVAGERLALLVARGRSAGWPAVPVHVAADLVAEAAAAVGALHQLGQAHGRLDLDHLVVEYRGRVRVIDGVTAAVEARLEGERPSPADDVHALAEVFEALLRGGALGLGRIEMGPYEGVIAQALAVDPARRPADGAALARLLRAAGKPPRNAATLAGWVRDACPERASAWRDVLHGLKGQPEPRLLKRLARLMAPAAPEAPTEANPPRFVPNPPPVASAPPAPPPPVASAPPPRVTAEVLVPPRVTTPAPSPGEDEPTTEVRSPARLAAQLPAPRPSGSTSEALFPIAAVTPAPGVGADGVPADGFEPDIDRPEATPEAEAPVGSVAALLGQPGGGRPSGDPHSAVVVEINAVVEGVVTESRVLHRGQRHALVRHRGERVELNVPKGAGGQLWHLGDARPLEAGRAVMLELGDRAELDWQGRRWTVRVDHAAAAPGRATGRRKPWGAWLTAVGGGLALHLLFVGGVVSLDAMGVQLTVDEPPEKERWARLEAKVLPDKPKPDKPRPKPKPKPRPKPVAPVQAPADPAEARPTATKPSRRKVREHMRAARTRAKDDAEALLNAVNAEPNAPGADGATLDEVVSTIDAVGRDGRTAALAVPGTLGTLPGGEVNIGRRQARLSPTGGKAIGRSVGRVGKKRSKGGRVRGKVRNLSSRTRVSNCDVSKSAVRAAVERSQGRVVGCYEKALLKRADLSGKITVEWRISTSGAATGTKVKVSTLGDPGVAQCVLGVIRKTRFPASKKGQCVITYPFIFSPSR